MWPTSAKPAAAAVATAASEAEIGGAVGAVVFARWPESGFMVRGRLRPVGPRKAPAEARSALEAVQEREGARQSYGAITAAIAYAHRGWWTAV